MTSHSIRPLTAAGALAIVLSSAHVSASAREEFRPVGRTLPRLAEALRAYRAADQSQDLEQRLRLQRDLADAIDEAAVVLLHDASLDAEEARRAVATLRVGLLGDTSRLDLGQAILDAVLKGESRPTGDALPAFADADTASLLELMASKIRVLRDAAAAGDAEQALGAQAELLNDARLLELIFRHVPTDTGRRVRSALDNLRIGLAGDSRHLDAATSAFGSLAQQEASVR